MTTTVLWRMKVHSNKEADFERLVLQLVRDVQANEPGNVFAYRRTQGEPHEYVLFLSFGDEQAYQRYSQAEWHRSVSPEIMACLAEPPVAENLDTF